MNMRNKALDASIRQIKIQYYFSKVAVCFFATVYMAAGFGMLVVSFWLEAEVFLTMLGDSPFISYLTAACLEGAKLGTIIVYDVINRKKQAEPIPNTVGEQIKSTTQLLFKRFFQISLFLISMLCVATVVSKRFDNPKQDEVKQYDLSTLRENYERSKTELTTSQEKEQKQLAEQQNKELDNIKAGYKPLIDQALAGMDAERHNIGRNGVVVGSNYESHERTLGIHNVNLQKELNTQKNLATQQTLEQSLRHANELKQLSDDFKTEQTRIEHDTYDNDHRVEHKNIHAIVKTMNAVLPLFGCERPLQPITFVALFALMLSAIIECGIFLALSSFVEVFLPHEFNVIELEMAAAQKKTSRYGLNPETTSND